MKFDEILGRTNREAIVVVLAPVKTPDELVHATNAFLRPALDALARGRVSSVKLIAGSERGAASWHARRSSWLAGLTRRRTHFIPPPAATFE